MRDPYKGQIGTYMAIVVVSWLLAIIILVEANAGLVGSWVGA